MGASTDQLGELFARRFEPDGDGYLFRANLAAPGFRVSAADRNRMIAEFQRAAAWTFRGAMAVLILLIAAVSWTYFRQDRTVPGYVSWGIVAVAICCVVIPHHWFWNSPRRELVGATPVVPGRSRDEVRRLVLARLSWGQLGAGLLGVAAIMWTIGAKTNFLEGWGRLWLILFAGLLLAIAVQAIRKLRFDRTRRRSGEA